MLFFGNPIKLKKSRPSSLILNERTGDSCNCFTNFRIAPVISDSVIRPDEKRGSSTSQTMRGVIRIEGKMLHPPPYGIGTQGPGRAR